MRDPNPPPIQKFYELPADGIRMNRYLNVIESVGPYGPNELGDVWAVQMLFNVLDNRQRGGLPAPPISGKYDKDLLALILKFQGRYPGLSLERGMIYPTTPFRSKYLQSTIEILNDNARWSARYNGWMNKIPKRPGDQDLDHIDVLFRTFPEMMLETRP